jgi:hypothetical protein
MVAEALPPWLQVLWLALAVVVAGGLVALWILIRKTSWWLRRGRRDRDAVD